MFLRALEAIVETILDPVVPQDEWLSGVRAFDELASTQKLALLIEITEALLDPMVPIPIQTAVNESAVAAVFRALEDELHFEVDVEPTSLELRQLVSQACAEAELADVPDPTCVDHSEWSICAQTLADQILWDADYDSDPSMLDDPPELSETFHRQFRIHPDYFTAIPPDPDSSQIDALESKLREFIREYGSDNENASNCS